MTAETSEALDELMRLYRAECAAAELSDRVERERRTREVQAEVRRVTSGLIDRLEARSGEGAELPRP